MSTTAPSHLLAAIPDDLLVHRHDNARADRIRGARLVAHCVALGMRPTLADLYDERLRRGIARTPWADLPRHYVTQDAEARRQREARRATRSR